MWLPYIYKESVKKSVSGEYRMYQLIPLHSCDYLQKTLIKINVATDEGKQLKWNVTLNKRWNWSSCTKLTLRASWTHGLIAQSVRVSERNSVVVGSNPTQANFLKLLQRIHQWWIPCIYMYMYIYVYIFIYIWNKCCGKGKKEKKRISLI